MCLVKSLSMPLSEPSLTWTTILDMIPIISDTFYAHLLSRMTIKSATPSCCRFLVRHFTSHILRAFDLKKEKDIKTTIFKPGFVKISFLTLVKKSNALFPPEPSLKYQKISSFYFLKSRYSDETHRKVFGCTLLPLISLKDFFHSLTQTVTIFKIISNININNTILLTNICLIFVQYLPNINPILA